VAVELAQVAAGLPVAASLALAGGITSFREGRRRATLNEAMHELRRPLQVLSLALPVDLPQAAPVESSLELATLALERLDREINGATLETVVVEVSVSELVEAAAQRWRNAAVSRGSSIQVRQNEREALVEANPFDLAQALDNLLSNAVEHGGGRVEIGWCLEADRVCISVADGGASGAVKTRVDRRGPGGRPRRGHGLRVVSRIARTHGGSFTLRRTPSGTEASLRLPLRVPGGEG
jgi:two-component system sensor histidine kinase TctE